MQNHCRFCVALIAALAAGNISVHRTAYAAYAADADAVSDAALQEIVVTAQRREESAQKTPIVMNVLTGQDLVTAGATDVIRAADLVPGVHVLVTDLSGVQIAIRGIVNNNVNVGSDPSLALSVDDLYVARSQAAFASFYDIQRIEVLRGPQGTLYGRNSISGAMNIITNDPQPEFGANAYVEAGNYRAVTTEGMVNLPMGDKIALRLAGEIVKHDGYVDHYWSNEDNKAARAKLKVQFSDDVSVVLAASLFKQGGNGAILPPFPFRTSNPWDPGDPTPRGQSSVNDAVYNFGAKFRWNTAIGDVTYIRGYTRFDEEYVAPPQGIYLARSGQSDQNTDEVRLASHTNADAAGNFSWVVGAFSYREIQNQTRVVAGNVALPPTFVLLPLAQTAGYPYVSAGSLAEFGQVTYAVVDHLRLIGGLRNTQDSKDASGFNHFSLGPMVIDTTDAVRQRESKITYKAGIEGDVSQASLLYASVTSGFHSGGWQDALPPYSNYLPETITSFEVGSKNEFFNHRLRFNVGAYFYDYKNFLVSATNNLPGNSTCSCFVNAPKARADGVEMELDYALTSNDRFALSAAYEDTSYTDFRIFQPWSANGVPGGTPIPATSTTPAGLDFSGTPFPYVSRFSGNVSYMHVYHMSAEREMSAQVETQFRTSYPGALGNDPSLRIGGFTKTDVSLSYSPSKHWTFTLWGRNLEASPAPTSAGTARPGAVSALNPITVTIGEPRTYGVRVSAAL